MLYSELRNTNTLISRSYGQGFPELGKTTIPLRGTGRYKMSREPEIAGLTKEARLREVLSQIHGSMRLFQFQHLPSCTRGIPFVAKPRRNERRRFH